MISRRPLGDSRLQFEKMERNLRRLKNKPYPKAPTSAFEICNSFRNPATMEEFGWNLRKTHRFYVDTIEIESSAFTLCVSHQIINMIEQNIPPGNRHILMDGTFDVTPIGCFYQLLVIYIEYKNDVRLQFFFQIYLFRSYYTTFDSFLISFSLTKIMITFF